MASSPAAAPAPSATAARRAPRSLTSSSSPTAHKTTRYKGVPNGSWHGSNHATTIDNQGALATVPFCETLKGRGIIVSVLYIPYQPVSPVNTSFAGNEDTYANNNIPYIPASLQKCASPGFFYTANAPSDITAALNAMFNHALQTAHITN